MAAPHVAGVAALYLQGHNGTPLQVRNAIVGAATPNVVKNRGTNSPNLLLYSLVP
jgi:subtilisin family serine protease